MLFRLSAWFCHVLHDNWYALARNLISRSLRDRNCVLEVRSGLRECDNVSERCSSFNGTGTSENCWIRNDDFDGILPFHEPAPAYESQKSAY